MRLRVVVADDEPLARTMVAALVRSDLDVARVIECRDAPEVKTALEQQQIDVAFLDIQMPGMSGMEVAKQFGPDGPAIVFVTAYAQHAPHAFEVEAVDYVTKPFTDARFAEAFERAKRRVRERRLGRLANQMAQLAGERSSLSAHDANAATAGRKLVVKDGDRSVVISERDIVWIEAEDYYVLLHSGSGRFMIRETLAAMEQRLSPEGFVRVHRGALVNIDAIKELRGGGSEAVLVTGAVVSISRSRRQHVTATLEARFR